MYDNCIDVFKDYNLPFETYVVKEYSHEPTKHDEIELVWLLKGSGYIECDRTCYVLGDQTLFMINVGQNHSMVIEKGSLMIAYRFKKEHLSQNNLSFSDFKFETRVYTFQELVIKYKEVPLLIANLLKLLVDSEEEQAIRFKIIGYYNMFVYELYTMLLKEKYLDIKSKNYDRYIERVKKVTEYVLIHYKEKISLEVLADVVGVSKYRLSHFIKEMMGISLQEFINNTRLEKALISLSKTQKPISLISEECGFSDVKYLNKLLKEKLNLTALKYRKVSQSHNKILYVSTIEELSEFSKALSQCLIYVK